MNPALGGRRRGVISAGYVLALMLLVSFGLDVALQAWPFQPTSPNWRWGLVGYVANGLPLPVAALFIVVVVSFLLGHLDVLRGTSWVSAGSALLGLIGMGLFVRDGLLLHRGSPAETYASFYNASLKAVLSLGLALAVLTILSIGARRAALPGTEEDSP